MLTYGHVAVFTGNLIAFISGTALTWSSPELPKFSSLEDTPFDHLLSDDEKSWIGSLLPLGAVIGPFIFGTAADKFGRKYTLLSLGIPFLICSLMMAFGKVVALFYAARFITGLAVGGTFTVVPMYIGEVSEDHNRGALGSSMNCFICFGLLFSYTLGPYVSVMVFNLVLAVFPAIYLVLFFILAAESAHYNVQKEQHEKAHKNLKKIRSHLPDEHVQKELLEIQTKIKDEGKGTFMDIFKSKGLIKAFVISVGLVSFQQLSGINAILFFSQDIFKSTGTSLAPEVCSIIVGGVQFGTSFITPLIADTLGRKMLLIISALGMLVSEIPLGVYSILKDNGTNVDSIAFLPIVALVVYIITYNCGFGPLPWAVLGELFPSNVKSSASAVVASICWLMGFLITKYFKAISDSIGMGESFLIFAGFCLAALFFSLFYVLETKGKTLSEIQKLLNK